MPAVSDFFDGLPDGPIGLAVSGGSDSVALLVLAVDWAHRRDRVVLAVTVDHGLRAEAAREAAGVSELCHRLGVAHEVLRWDGQHAGNTQDAARRARHGLINDWAVRHGVSAVATGHTKDDQAETFLLRLKRGSGVDGLASMAARVRKDGVLWVRPVLDERRAALRDLLVAQDIGWVDDPSNEDEQYDRVKMRKALILLNEVGVNVETLADTAARLQVARTALEVATLEAAKSVATPRDIGSVRLDIPALRAVPEEVQLRLLAHVFRWISGSMYRPRLQALKLALAAVLDGQAHSLAGCLVATAKADKVEISRETAAIAPKDAAFGEFDGRWRCDVAQGIWRALGEDGLSKRPDWRDIAEHRNSLLASPSLWYNNELKSAPFVDKTDTCRCWLREGRESFFGSIMTH